MLDKRQSMAAVWNISSVKGVSMHHKGGSKSCQMECVQLQINGHMSSVAERILCVLHTTCADDGQLRAFVLECLSEAAKFMFSLFQKEMETLLHSAAENVQQRMKLGPDQEQPQPQQEQQDQKQPQPQQEQQDQKQPQPPQDHDQPQPPQEQQDQKQPQPPQDHDQPQPPQKQDHDQPQPPQEQQHQDQPDPPQIQTLLLQEPREADNDLTLTLAVKSIVKDGDGDDENRDPKPAAGTSTRHLETQPAAVCRPSSRPARDHHRQLSSDGSECDDEDTQEEVTENLLPGCEEEEVCHQPQESGPSLDAQPPQSKEEQQKELLQKAEEAAAGSSLEVQHGGSPVACSVCGETFSQPCHLKLHMKSHAGDRTSTRRRTFACSVCGDAFGRIDLFDSHMRTHARREKTFACSVCSKSYSHKQTLEIHMRNHTAASEDEENRRTEKPRSGTSAEHWNVKQHAGTCGGGRRPYKCSVCSKGFAVPVWLQRHERSHTKEKNFACSVCGKRYRQPETLKTHMRRGHRPAVKSFACSICSKSFCHKQTLQIHMMNHTAASEDEETAEHPDMHATPPRNGKQGATTLAGGKRPFTCLVCGKGFAIAARLRRHAIIHTGEKNFACSVCGESYRYLETLKVHIKRNHPPTGEGAPVDCVVCGESFSDSDATCSHVTTQILREGEKLFARSRAKDKSLICPVCGKCFRLPSRLKNHELTHTKKAKAKPFICSVCGKSFYSKHTLEPHSRTHTGERPYLCVICGKSYRHYSNMKDHMTSHAGEKPYACSVCGRGFTVYGNMKSHMRTHTDEKLFSCSVCGQRFRFSQSLKRHTRLHTGEKPFVCSVCGKGFTESRGLKNHMVNHTGIRPFVCSVCGNSFGNAQHLRRHTKIHTRDRLKSIQ